VALRLVIIVASRFALRDGLRQRGRTFLLLTQHLFLIPARRDSETYRATIDRPWRDWSIANERLTHFLDGMKKAHSTPGAASPGVFFLFCRATQYGSPKGFRASGVHEELPQWLKPDIL
jgi:hypothetical protein